MTEIERAGRALRDAAFRQGVEEAAQLVENIQILRDHAGMTAIENMNLLMETIAERIRAIATPQEGP